MEKYGSRYKFEYYANYPQQSDIKVTMETNSESLSDLLENIELFLRGSGFTFEGSLEIVPEEE